MVKRKGKSRTYSDDEVEKVFEFKGGRYHVRLRGGRSAWLWASSMHCPKALTTFWSEREKHMTNTNRRSLALGRRTQADLQKARAVLKKNMHRDGVRADLLRERSEQLDTRTKELQLSELVVKVGQQDLAALGERTRALEVENEALRRSEAALRVRLDSVTPARGVPGEIVRYDLGRDEYLIKDPETLQLQKHPSTGFGANFHSATIFWIRCLMRYHSGGGTPQFNV